ncbi:hypothetical protein, partial [Nostoc sp. CCY0012]|uniref:hypothetical protein n=1 Tax=Nostoc sp. CCY0012 TaxID=1056123 RepID=UPI0039C6436A
TLLHQPFFLYSFFGYSIVRTEDFNTLPKFKAASKLALGISEKEDLPFYIYAPEQIAVEIPLKPEDRTYYDFPVRQWNHGDRLIERGFVTRLEVQANGGRADIVSNWQGGVIAEVKKYLNRDTIYQAVGQLNLYGLNNTHKLIVMGFLSPDAREQASALKTASMVEQNPRIQVVFVNTDEEWLPGSQVQIGFGNFSLWNLRLPQLPNFKDWRWWFNLAKTHPLVLVLAGSLLLGILPELRKQTPTPVNNMQFTSGQTYSFRGSQIRFHRQIKSGASSRFVFFDSSGKRKEIGQQFISEVQEVQILSEQ